MGCRVQSDVEKLEGLPVAANMDREKVTKPSSQVGFIKFVLLPLFEALGEKFPVITVRLIVVIALVKVLARCWCGNCMCVDVHKLVLHYLSCVMIVYVG